MSPQSSTGTELELGSCAVEEEEEVVVQDTVLEGFSLVSAII